MAVGAVMTFLLGMMAGAIIEAGYVVWTDWRGRRG